MTELPGDLTLMELWQTLSGMVIDWHLTAPLLKLIGTGL